MKLLALETSTESCSVALRVGGEVRVLRHAGAREQTAHVLPMVQAVVAEAGLRLQDLDAGACAQGPGAFTGVRVAVSVAQGLAFGAQLPAIGVSTLAALALQAVREAADCEKGVGDIFARKNDSDPFFFKDPAFVLPLLDARMGELYAGAYRVDDDGLVSALVPDRLVRPEDFAAGVPVPEGGARWLRIGSGWPLLLAGSADAETPGEENRFLAGLSFADAAPLAREPDALDVLALAARAFARGEAVPAMQLLPVYLRDTVTWKKLAEQGKP
jgi:tRNA threonylcarbamoyladenosine biosynthesis protein TsaB